MKFKSTALLSQLELDVKQIIARCKQLEHMDDATLQTVPAPGKWSVAQVLEHLNIYSRHYIAAVENKLHHHQTSPAFSFKPGWLGNYFTRLMKPGADNKIAKKMKAPKNAQPATQPAAAMMLQEFLAHQFHLLNLLAIARSASLNNIRIPTSLSKFIRLKLGDTFRFFIAHEQRHFVQIDNTLKTVLKNKPAAVSGILQVQSYAQNRSSTILNQ
ncbi:MAG: DinB family protein [Ferruginibacter sp.]